MAKFCIRLLSIGACSLSAALFIQPVLNLAAGADSQPKLPHLQAEKPIEALPTPSPEPKTSTGDNSNQSASQGQPQATEDTYPVIGQLETITFGQSKPNLTIADRLNKLELAIFQKSFPDLSLEKRSEKLKETILGNSSDLDIRSKITQPLSREPDEIPSNSPPTSFGRAPGQIDPNLTQAWNQPFYQAIVSRDELGHFALDLVNKDRQREGLTPLKWDNISYQVAQSLVDDLAKRDTVSHLNKAGENPDVRYTKAGGNDAISESLTSIQGPQAQLVNRALVAQVLATMKVHQDDRDALMSPDATHFGFDINTANQKDKAIACVEIVTKHAIMNPVPNVMKVGQKVELKGVLLEPYHFQKVTIAWEGLAADKTTDSSQDADELQDEAMPYFPPLDYIVFAEKAEHDREKLMMVLKTTGIIACIAGGVFIPPVALAAPLVAMAPSGGGAPKAAADTPVKGGIKVHGTLFSGNLPINHQGKAGLYYLTVWAATSDFGHPVPISRRTIQVTSAGPEISSERKTSAKAKKGSISASKDKLNTSSNETSHASSPAEL